MRYPLRPAAPEEIDFAFEVKRDAMGAHIRARWLWDETFQRQQHANRWQEKPWFIVCEEAAAIGVISLQWKNTHLQLGEFYLLAEHRGRGKGSTVLRDVLSQADERRLVPGSSS